jgi:hypothetical protein
MPRIADFVIVPDTDETVTLHTNPDDGVNDFHSREFDAPAVNGGSRAVLTFRVNPSGNVRLQVVLNDRDIVNRRFDTEPHRSWHEIVAANVLQASGNILDVALLEGEKVTVSDFVVFFQANIP